MLSAWTVDYNINGNCRLQYQLPSDTTTQLSLIYDLQKSTSIDLRLWAQYLQEVTSDKRSFWIVWTSTGFIKAAFMGTISGYLWIWNTWYREGMCSSGWAPIWTVSEMRAAQEQYKLVEILSHLDLERDLDFYVSCFPPEDWWSRKQPMKFLKNINRNSDWSNLASTLLAFRQLLGQRSRGQWRFCPVTLTGTEWVWMFAFNPIKILVVHGTIHNPTPQNTNKTHHDVFWWIIQRSINWLCVTKLIINAAKKCC